MQQYAPCKLALADGTVVTGQAIGASGEAGGELCFNTSMTGYQEILTDPSYHGQIMMMTYPHIGNYGATDTDDEAPAPMVAALVVRAFSRRYSNECATESLQDYMQRHGLIGISGVDTRRLVLHIRHRGVMNAVVSSVDLDEDSLVAKAQAWPSMEGLELASRVSTGQAYDYAEGSGPRIAVYDYGCKLNILRTFEHHSCHVRVFPHDAPLADVLAWEPDGFFLSNGPGDPRVMPAALEVVRGIIRSGRPAFGICLGHQLMALAQNLAVFKMRVGHRGANQPVKNLQTGRVEVTTQNHGFSVDPARVEGADAVITHTNLNDGTLEGLHYRAFSGLSVQYHPEASPGPHDSRYLFGAFLRLIGPK